jgi:dTDP-4-amino-4,6-dideoxygalactose transaminase
LPSFEQDLDLPITEKVAAQCLSLPVHPSLSQDDLQTIAETVNTVANSGR